MENYQNKDIAKLTDIAESTVRKYAQLLEKYGYIFNRNINGNRVFNDQDVKVFLDFKLISKDHSVDDTAKIVADKHIAKPNTEEESMLDDTQSPQGFERAMLGDLMSKVDKLTNMSKNQEKFNQELLKELTLQRERNLKFMESVNQWKEDQKGILQIAAEQEKKKGFFARIFHK